MVLQDISVLVELPVKTFSDLKNMQKESVNFGIEGSPRGDNLFVWVSKQTGIQYIINALKIFFMYPNSVVD